MVENNVSKKTIINANLVLENGVLWDSALVIQGDVISEIKSMRDIHVSRKDGIIDAKGAYVGPGFVDIHVHGGDGHCTSFDSVAASKHFLKHGTTTMLSTPAYEFDRDKFLDAIRTAKAKMKKTKNIKGLYCEGPYINVNYGAYAHLNPWRGPINKKDYEALVDEAGEDVKVWTIAPEREGIVDFLEYARKGNPDVVFAVGHSEATPSQIRALGKYRPTLQTHSMCATGRLPTYGGTRGFGPDEYFFKETDAYCELICDSCGIHVNPEMQQLLIHTKGIEKIVLITDAADMNFHGSFSAPEKFKHVTDLLFDDRGGIAGSKLTMDVVCKNIMTHTNCGIAQAFVMASLNPAKVLKMDDQIGSIEVGKKADLVFVDDRFNVKQVIIGGEKEKTVE